MGNRHFNSNPLFVFVLMNCFHKKAATVQIILCDFLNIRITIKQIAFLYFSQVISCLIIMHKASSYVFPK